MSNYKTINDGNILVPVDYSQDISLEQKSITGGEAISRLVDGRPRYSIWSTTQAVSKGYAENAIVYAAVNKIVNAFSSVPLVVEKTINGGGTWEPAPDSLAQNLINRPNPFDTQTSFKKKIAYHLLLTGNAIWTKIRASDNKTVYNMWPHMPQHVNPVRSQTMWVSQYEFKAPGTKTKCISRDDVLHFMEINPADFHWGLSRILVLMKLIQTNAEQLDFQNASMANRGVISGIMHHEGNPSTQQFQKARQKIERDLKGTSNARRIIQTSNKITWEQIGFSPQELDFLKSRTEGFKEIAVGIGVPYPLLSVEGSTFNNMSEAQKIFWGDTVIPLAADIADLLNCHLMPEFNERERGRLCEYRARFDFSGVKALQEDFHKKVKSAVSLIKCDVFEPLAVNRVLELGFTEDDLKKLEPESPALPESLDNEIIQELTEPLALPSTKSRQAVEYKTFEDDRRRYEARARRSISKLFEGELKLILDAFDEGEDLETALPKILEALEDNEDSWLELLSTLYETGIDFFARSEYNRGEKEIKSISYSKKAYEGLNANIRNFINRVVGERVEGISKTTRDVLTTLVIEAQSRNLSTEVLREAIRQRYAQFQDSRSKLISETEHTTITGRGAGYGAEVLADDNDQELVKTWRTKGDDLVRDSHVEVNGETVPYNERFSNGLFEPGDEDAPIAEVANCRCKLDYTYRDRN